VKLIVEDADHHVCESFYNYVTANDLSSCAVNMSLTHAGRRDVFFDGVMIQWRDASNTLYKTDKVVQPSESYFEIIKSETFDPNEKGEAGRLLTMRFNLLLSDGSRKIRFKSEDAVIAVSYK
jgi:hypothetical protein